MYCSKCGYQISDRGQYCAHCGTRVANPAPRSLSLTFVEGNRILTERTVDTGADGTIAFGRERDNDMVVAPPSETVSRHHGTFEVRNGQLFVVDNQSKNGLYYNGTRNSRIPLAVGDVVTVGMPQRGKSRTILVVGEGDKHWNMLDLLGRTELSIGRLPQNDLVLPDPTVSARHARLMKNQAGGWSIDDLGSSNGTRVNGTFVSGETQLVAGSVLVIGNTRMVFLDACLLVVAEQQGVEVVATDLVRYRTNRGVRRITTDHVSLRIKRGEFVAIVGGSGCGKSTLLNELNGSDPADEGSVLLDGTDLYANYEMLKSSIGYVPQQDIVYDNLRLSDMLLYAAELRMQPDTSEQERETRVDEVIALLELESVRDNLIGNLSGGQKKRASIAVELLADPRLLFLDEPTSGLDPGIERKLMATLADMAHEGRTVVLVTHTTLNLHLCDQVVFLGSGGKLCFAGNPQQAASFFGVSDFVDVYNVIGEDAELWEQRFAYRRHQMYKAEAARPSVGSVAAHRVPSFWSQFATLSTRYAKLIVNDHSRLALLLLQAPALAALISLVAGNDCFTVYEPTKSCLFAMSCAAFWVGILNSIQEICKEQNIFRREYEGGMKLSAYLASKLFVLGLLCILQSFLLVLVFMLFNSVPQNTLIPAPLELFVTTYLTAESAMCLGLFVSALFRNPDRAIAVAPLLIMPQILFSGLAFELHGATDAISHAANCRWAMEAYGQTANLNELELAIARDAQEPPPDERFDDRADGVAEPEKVQIPREDGSYDSWDAMFASMYAHEYEEMYERSPGHLARCWGMLAVFCVVPTVACGVTLAMRVRR